MLDGQALNLLFGGILERGNFVIRCEHACPSSFLCEGMIVLFELVTSPAMIEDELRYMHPNRDGLPAQAPSDRNVARFIAARVRRGEYIYGKTKGWVKRETWELGEPMTMSLKRWNDEGRPDCYRAIFKLTQPEMALHRMVSRHLMKKIKTWFAPGCYGYIPGRGRVLAVRDTRRWIQEEKPGWAVRFDVRSFNESVSHSVLKTAVADVISDWYSQDAAVLNGCIKSLIAHAGEAGYLEGRGLLLGSPLSGPLTNIYLTPLDRYLTSSGCRFIRFGDDILALLHARSQAEEILGTLQEMTSTGLQQEMNKNKSGVFEIGRNHSPPGRRISRIKRERAIRMMKDLEAGGVEPGGFDFLGFHFDSKTMRIREETMLKIASKLKRFTQAPKKDDALAGSKHREALVLITVKDIEKCIERLRNRLGYHRRIGRLTEKGWVKAIVSCGLTNEIMAQFNALDWYMTSRVLHYSSNCWMLNRRVMLTCGELQQKGLRTFRQAVGDYQMVCRAAARQRGSKHS